MRKFVHYTVLSIIALSGVIRTVDVLADVGSGRVTLGGGYTCDTEAKLIYKGNGTKPVKLKKAKEVLSEKISALGSSKKDKAKKAALKAAKAQLKPCTDGTPLATPTPTPTPGGGGGSNRPGGEDFCQAHPKHPRCR